LNRSISRPPANSHGLGTWSKRQIAPSGLATPNFIGLRGKLATDASGNNLIAILPDEPAMQMKIYGATASGNFENWTLLATISNTASEPLIDTTRLSETGVLSVFVRQGGPFGQRMVQVWDFGLSF
jgi:hypothetical protein